MVGLIMKDMFGTEIKVGDNIVLVASAGGRRFERAGIIEVNPGNVKMLFSGNNTCRFGRGKKSGEISISIVPEDKVMICSSNSGAEVNIYNLERVRFEKEIKINKSKLDTALKSVDDLLKENALLQAEVEKIHNRFDILDL